MSHSSMKVFKLPERIKVLFTELKKIGPIETWYGENINTVEALYSLLTTGDTPNSPWLCRSKYKSSFMMVVKNNSVIDIRTNTKMTTTPIIFSKSA